ncbi:MAG TPA: hypothetical protein PLM49_05595, partial [Bacteroidales bacterium]|nr:hypothetical protein [Bacteroidales bacterium]
SGQKSGEGIIRDGKPDGYWRSWYENGQLKSEGLRTNFMLDSIWNFYYYSGQLHQSISYRNDQKNGYTSSFVLDINNIDTLYYQASKELFLNGIRQGESFYYHPNGQLMMSIYFRNDKRHGNGKEYDESGNIVALFEYFNGYLIENLKINRFDYQNRKQGRWMEFYKNGNVFTDASYMNDKLHGYYREYNEAGVLIKEMRYLNGDVVTRDIEEEYKIKADVRTLYNPNGTLKYTGAFLENKAVGVHNEYDENGRLQTAKVYNEFGVLTAQGLFDEQGNRIGKWTLFYDDGKIMGTGSYLKNLKQDCGSIITATAIRNKKANIATINPRDIGFGIMLRGKFYAKRITNSENVKDCLSNTTKMETLLPKENISMDTELENGSTM